MIVLKIFKPKKKSLNPPLPLEIPQPVEKRQTERSDHVVKVSYKVLLPMEGEGFTQDISQDGLGLFLDNEVPPGAVMELKFKETPKGTQPAKPIAKVMWQKDSQTGVKVLGR